MFIVDERNRYSPPPPSVHELRAEASRADAEWRRWEHWRTVTLPGFMREAESKLALHQGRIGKLRAEQAAIESAPRTNMYLDPGGDVRVDGLHPDAIARHRQLEVEIAREERAYQSWVNEQARQDVDRVHGTP